MGGRIIHYGVDEYYRLRTLRSAGYKVDNCNSLNEFRWVLYSGGRAEAVLFTEAAGPAPRTAISLARDKSSAVVLFQGWTPHYDESEFNLVVPMLTAPEQWLSGIDALIERTLITIRGSSEPRAKSRALCEERLPVPERASERVTLGTDERERNREFKLDFHNLEGAGPDAGAGLGATGFLAALDRNALREFRRLMGRASYPAGTTLFRQGELPHTIWFVFGGEVKLAVDSGDGRRFILRIARAGELLGLAPAFASCAHQVTAEVSATCDVGSARSVEFMQFLEKHAEAFRAAAQEMGRAYNQTCMRLRTMGVNFRVTARLAGLLLEWAESGNETARGTTICVGLTHEEIGQCIGTTRESVWRVLHELENRKVIEVHGSMVTILDRAALEDCACGSGEG